MLGISLYSYLYLKIAKILSLLFSLMFFLQQNWRTKGQNRFFLGAGEEWRGSGGPNNVYTWVNVKTILKGQIHRKKNHSITILHMTELSFQIIFPSVLEKYEVTTLTMCLTIYSPHRHNMCNSNTTTKCQGYGAI
jgi:hypothetical protein